MRARKSVPPVEPSLALHEVEEQHAREVEQGESVAFHLGSGSGQRGGHPVERDTEGSEEAPADGFALECFGRTSRVSERPAGCSGGSGQSAEAGEREPVRGRQGCIRRPVARRTQLPRRDGAPPGRARARPPRGRGPGADGPVEGPLARRSRPRSRTRGSRRTRPQARPIRGQPRCRAAPPRNGARGPARRRDGADRPADGASGRTLATLTGDGSTIGAVTMRTNLPRAGTLPAQTVAEEPATGYHDSPRAQHAARARIRTESPGDAYRHHDASARHFLSFLWPSRPPPPAQAPPAGRPARSSTITERSSCAAAPTRSRRRSSPARGWRSKGACCSRPRSSCPSAIALIVAPDATVPLVEVTVRNGPDSGTVQAKFTQRTRVVFRDDSVAVDDMGGRGLKTLVLGTERGAMPYINLSFALLEQAVRRARSLGAGAAEVPFFNLSGTDRQSGQTIRGKVTPVGSGLGNRGDRRGGVQAAGGPGGPAARRRRFRRRI